MSILGDFVEQVTKTVLSQTMQKLGGKRRRRRLSPRQKITNAIKEALMPAKRQVSRKRTTRARSKTVRRGY